MRVSLVLLKSRANQGLEFLKLAHERRRLCRLHLALAFQLLILVPKSCHFLTKIPAIISYNPSLSLHASSLAPVFLSLFFVLDFSSIGVHTTEVLV